MEKIELKQDNKGCFSCYGPISKEQWLDMLTDTSVIRPEFREVLLSFYYMPGHRASCAACAEKYGHEINRYNSAVTALGRAVVKKLGTFIITDAEGKERFWPVAMGCGRYVKNRSQFEWTLRPELTAALRELIIDDAINQYTSAFDENIKKEAYKWQAVQWFQNHWHLNDADLASMIDFATAKTGNLLASASSYPRKMLVAFAMAAPAEVRAMLTDLFDENAGIAGRVAGFMGMSEKIRNDFNPGSWKMHYQTTNAASVYLWLRYPDKYYIYKPTEYCNVISKLGLDTTVKQNGKAEEMVKGFGIYDMLNSRLCANGACVAKIRGYLGANPDLYPDPQLRTATVDLGFWISRYYNSPENSLYKKKKTVLTPFISEAAEVLRDKKNLILQGAPGTGKTYNTAALALAVIDGSVPESHDEVMKRYEELRRQGRIGFTTFHQSMDYEDFIEGIKPVHEGDSVRYEIEDGIFKRMCSAARVASEVAASGTDKLLDGMNEDPKIWKVSLQGTFDNPLRRDCMENGYIRIGWGDYGDFEYDDDEMKGKEGKNVLKAFMNDMRTGDIVVSCWSQDETDAIGIVTGEYEYRAEGGDYPRYRAVRWIFKGKHHNIKEINGGKHMTLGTVYNLFSISLKDIIGVIEQYAPKSSISADNEERPFVLIIDEINRGNVSKIFGELITLLEKDKRLADSHPITLTLPYSKTEFGVPQNLYIIGTMNTTDRSTGTLDYAIRRRFRFITLPADGNLIEDEAARQIFSDIRAFIERYKYADMDIEDLMVGHSYFMADSDAELLLKIKYEVIPLLKEYIKDGILSIKPADAARCFKAWEQLQTAGNDSEADDNGSGTPED